MNQEKINKFKKHIELLELDEASKMIPEVLSYEQYINFCARAFFYTKKNSDMAKAYRFELASIQATRTREREQEMLAAEARAKTAEEVAWFARSVYEDSEASFKLMSEKAAEFYNKDIIMMALWELEK